MPPLAKKNHQIKKLLNWRKNEARQRVQASCAWVEWILINSGTSGCLRLVRQCPRNKLPKSLKTSVVCLGRSSRHEKIP